MIQAIKPITQQAYTNKGNEYTESNIGKYAAGASLAGTTTFYGGKFAIKKAKTAYNKAKTIKIEIPKFEKTDLKTVKKELKTVKKSLEKAIKTISKKLPTKKTVKLFIKNAPAKLKSGLQKAGEYSKEGIRIAKENIKKINVENLKKAGKTLSEFAKRPEVQKTAGFAAGLAVVIAAGYAIDFIANKISEYKADHKNVLVK